MLSARLPENTSRHHVAPPAHPTARPTGETRPDDRPADDLAGRFAGGDPEVLHAIHDRYAGPMFTAALHLLGGDRVLAEEAVQVALMKAWRAAPTFDGNRALAPWLYAIVRRCAIDIRRHEQRHFSESIDTPGRDHAIAVPDGFEPAWEAWIVREAVSALPAEEHAVMHLTYFRGLTQREVAHELDIPLGTVKSRSARAHARLRSLVGPQLALAG
jgi:RNA polymerase sigma-70 factor (ECF subfamily)